MRKMWMMMVVAAVVAALVSGCSDDRPGDASVSDGVCGEGQEVVFEEDTYCVYDAELIIEGFRCPGAVASRHDFDGFLVCAPTDVLEPAFLDELRDRGRRPLPLPKADPGDVCDQPGAQVEANDGCNTCVCEQGGWACTEIACVTGVCQDGQLGYSGCVECECEGGQWSCPDVACGGACGSVSQASCSQELGCGWVQCPDDLSVEECPEGVRGACVERVVPGRTACEYPGLSMPSVDGCNTCTCEEGSDWSCTEEPCGDVGPPDPVCEEGEFLSNECEDCPCVDGQWLCLDNDCFYCPDFGNAEDCEGEGCLWLECPEGDFDCPTGNGGFCASPAHPGSSCEYPELDFASFPADDGCNTCFCDGAAYSCTEIACDEPICQEGDTMEMGCGGDCVCNDGQWLCDDVDCPPCDSLTDFDICDQYRGHCGWVECPQDDFDCPTDNGGFCADLAQPGAMCEDLGVSVPAADGCNTCFCDEGSYACTELDCGE